MKNLLQRSLTLQSAFYSIFYFFSVFLISLSLLLYVLNPSHKDHYSDVPAVIAVTLSHSLDSPTIPLITESVIPYLSWNSTSASCLIGSCCIGPASLGPKEALKSCSIGDADCIVLCKVRAAYEMKYFSAFSGAEKKH